MRRYLKKNPKSYNPLYAGLKQVHIGNDVWLVGRPNKTLTHIVIYAPDRKTEHHIDGYKEVMKLFNNGYHNDEYRHVCRNVNTIDVASVKIYILTSILDDRNNWCFSILDDRNNRYFDLKNIPDIGYLKVIYDNGTVKNIEFNGIFEKQELISQRFVSVEYYIKSRKYVNPVAYRIKKPLNSKD